MRKRIFLVVIELFITILSVILTETTKSTMTLTYFNDINVYFHMKNHYKMLKRVKSVVDTSLPQSLLKSPLAMNNWDKRLKGATNEQLKKIYNAPLYTPKGVGQIKRHDCLSCETRSEAFLKGQGPHSRPTTRRNPSVTPREALPPRPSSVGSSRKSDRAFKFRHKKRPISISKSNDTEIESIDEKSEEEKISDDKSYMELMEERQIDDCVKESDISPEKSPVHSAKSFLKSSSEDHQYLLFLLRITEDIIVNDFYSNNDIRQVFRLHIEANKQRLDLDKMHFHISNLCKELNIKCPEYTSQKIDVEHTLATPSGHYMNSEAFKTCAECSVIRTSSLHKMQPPMGESFMGGDGLMVPLIENGVDSNISISPSLLKVLEKLSLSRLTECTEPVPSTSTVGSPKTSKNCGDFDKPLLDFDSFVKELNCKDISNDLDLEVQNYKKLITLESPPKDINLFERNQEKEDADTPLEDVASEKEISQRTQIDHVATKIDDKASVLSTEHPSTDDLLKVHDNNVNCIYVNDKLCKDPEVEIVVSSCSSSLPGKGFFPESPNPTKNTPPNSDETTVNILAPTQRDLKCFPYEEPNVKVILQGHINDEDYVMVKGPVYILKALLQTDPKLVIFDENHGDDHDSLKSVGSQMSHRTFTVDTSRVDGAPLVEDDRVDQGVQFDTSLHSLEVENSIENILQLTRRAYSQFTDSKLLNSDYDLTPQRDNSDKYHHLLVDASSSVSGVNLTENLLLSDDYLVQNNQNIPLKAQVDTVENINDYLKPEQKITEQNYINQSCIIPSNTTTSRIVSGEDMTHLQLKVEGNDALISQDSSLRSEGETSVIPPTLSLLNNSLLWNGYCK